MTPPVFISYARSTSHPHAKKLLDALADSGTAAFLDEATLEHGDEVPHELAEAILNARVAVIFADDLYFERPVCQWELSAILSSFLAMAPDAPDDAKREALAHVIVVRPPGGQPPRYKLPLLLEEKHWPAADRPDDVKALVERQLGSSPRSLAERLRAVARLDVTREALRCQARLRPLAPGRPAPCFPYDLPRSLGTAFVGRTEELWRIHYYLSLGDTSAVALEGGPGIGKGQLALEYFHRFGTHRFPGGRFWLKADSPPETLHQDLHNILRELNPTAPDLKDLQDDDVMKNLRTLLGKELFKAVEQGPVLFVLDNLPEPPSGKEDPLLDSWLWMPQGVALLTTSRYHYSTTTPRVVPLRIRELKPDDAVQMLTYNLDAQRIRRDDLTSDEWKQIARKVDFLPLALRLLAGTLASRRLPPRELLQEILKDHPLDGEIPTDLKAMRHTAFEAFAISYRCLPEEGKRMARLLAHLAPEVQVPSELWAAFGFSREVFSALVLHSFVVPISSSAGDSHSAETLGGMHELLSSFLRSQAAPEQIHEEELKTYQTLAAIFRGDFADANTRTLMDACMPHADWLMGSAHSFPGTEASEPLEFMHAFHDFIHAKGLWHRAHDIAQTALAMAQNSRGETDPRTLSAKASLANTLYSLGKLDAARALQEEVLREQLRTPERASMDALNAMSNLAATLDALGLRSEARAQKETVLALRREVLGDKHPHTLSAMSNLAATLGQLGLHSEARAQQETVLALLREVLGDKHPHTLSAMNNLASTLGALGLHSEARAQQETVLALRREVLGDTHPATLNAMSNLAMTLGSLGLHSEARAQQETVLALLKEVLGDKHPHTLIVMGNLAMTLGALGLHSEARAQQETVLAVRREMLGDTHPDTLNAMSNLAATLGALGLHSEARAQQEMVLALRREVLGDKHPHTLIATGNLAMTLDALGLHLEARAQKETVLALRREVLGDTHPDTLIAMNNLASSYAHVGRWYQGRVLQAQAVEAMRSSLGDSHPWTQHAQKSLDAMLSTQAGREHLPRMLSREDEQQIDDREEAHFLWKESERIHGPTHTNALSARYNYALKLKEQGQFNDARPLLEYVLEHRRQCLDSSHPDVFSVMEELSSVYRNLALHAQAQELLNEIRAARPKAETAPTTTPPPSTSGLVPDWLVLLLVLSAVIILALVFAHSH